MTLAGCHANQMFPSATAVEATQCCTVVPGVIITSLLCTHGLCFLQHAYSASTFLLSIIASNTAGPLRYVPFFSTLAPLRLGREDLFPGDTTVLSDYPSSPARPAPRHVG